MAKLKIDAKLVERAKRAAETAGYSSVEEFVSHLIEREVARFESDESEGQVEKWLQGLGYIE